MKRRRYSIDPLSYHIVVIFLLLTAALAEAEITPKPYEIAQEVTQHVFRIVASQCSNGVNRILTGFFLQGVGIVTAAHGVIGCKLITATPASGTLPESIAAAVTQIALDRDLAALKWVDAQPPTPQGLSQYNSASKPDLGFNVCGHASWFKKYSCRVVLIKLYETHALSTILRADSTETGEERRKSFIKRGSPNPEIHVHLISAGRLLGPGDSGAPVIDNGSGSVIAVVNGGIDVEGRWVPWAIPLDGTSWTKSNDSRAEILIERLGKMPLPSELTVAEENSRAPVRTMTAQEQILFDNAVRSFAQGLLETYPCQWMLVGVKLLNTFCAGVPCGGSEVGHHYDREIKTFTDPEIKTVCTAIVDSVAGFFSGAYQEPLKCNVQESHLWFSRYANVPFRILLSPQELGNGAQPALLRNIAWDQVPYNEQTTVLDSVLGEWEKVSTRGNPGLLKAATQSFTDLVTSCEPAGCELGDAITTNDSWSFVRMKLFEKWLDYFAETPPPVSGGCSTTRILRDAALGEWRLDTESSSCKSISDKNISDCLTFGEPIQTAQAATRFAATLPKGYAHLDLLLTPVRAVAKSGDPIAYQLKVKNSGGITSPSGIVNVVLPSCLKVETQPPESLFDEKKGIIRWSVQGLGKGDSRSSSVSVRVTECPAAQYPLSVEFVLIREDGIEAVSVTGKIRLPQPTDDITSNAEARRLLGLMMHPNEQVRGRAFEGLIRFVLEDDKKRALREFVEALMADLSSTDEGRQNRAHEEIRKLLAQ